MPRSAIVSFYVVPCKLNYVLLVELEKREKMLEEKCGDLDKEESNTGQI